MILRSCADSCAHIGLGSLVQRLQGNLGCYLDLCEALLTHVAAAAAAMTARALAAAAAAASPQAPLLALSFAPAGVLTGATADGATSSSGNHEHAHHPQVQRQQQRQQQQRPQNGHGGQCHQQDVPGHGGKGLSPAGIAIEASGTSMHAHAPNGAALRDTMDAFVTAPNGLGATNGTVLNGVAANNDSSMDMDF